MEPVELKAGAGGANNKAVAALVLGIVATVCAVIVALMFSVWTDEFDDSALWLLPVFLAAACGTTAAFLGSLGWIDVRRGVTNRHLRAAQVGAILGGIVTTLVVIAVAVLIVMFILLLAALLAGD